VEHQLTTGELWTAIAAGCFAIIATLGGVQYTFHRQNRKDAKAQRELETEHQKQVDYIVREYGFHGHDEEDSDTDVPLTSKGIRRPRTKFNGS